MKSHEVVKDVFVVGGSEITDARDASVYLLRLGELILIDSGAGLCPTAKNTGSIET